MSAPAAVGGLLGGLCWIAAYVVDTVSGGGLVDALSWAGLVLLTAAVAGAGAGLVSRSAGWLRVVVAVCFVLLAGSVLQVVRDSADPLLVDAAAGGLAAVASVAALSRRRPAPVARGHVATRRVRGSHAR
jgi:hypothetical protein